MKKNLLLTAILSLSVGSTFADGVILPGIPGNIAHGNSVITNAEGSVNTGWNSTITDVKNTNSVGSANNIQSTTDVNLNGNNNTVQNADNTSIMGNRNNATDANNSQVLGNDNTVSGNNNVAIGNGNTVSGENSIGIGGGTASNGGIAIGSGSTASRSDEVNFGDRQLTGVKDGVLDTDAVNVGQMNNKANETLNNAQNYTDSKVPQVINEANQYTDQQYNQAIDQLFQKNRGYIDSQINRLDKKIDNYRSDAFAGVAGAMAMASIPKKEGFKTSFGVGVANYRSQQAIAAGIEHNTTDKTVVKFNFSSDTQGGIGLGAGFAFGAN